MRGELEMDNILEICEELMKHIDECNQREYCDGDDLYILEQGIQAIQSIAYRYLRNEELVDEVCDKIMALVIREHDADYNGHYCVEMIKKDKVEEIVDEVRYSYDKQSN